MATPEGRVKAKVKRLLDKYEGRVYSNWPVPNGFGSPTLDCWGAIRGVPFAVETKVPGKKPTPRQEMTIEEMQTGGITTFVIYDDATLSIFAVWLDAVDKAVLSEMARKVA